MRAMKWVLFTGTWRLTNEAVQTAVRNSAVDVLHRGDAILTGGATGVDFFAMDESFGMDNRAGHLRVVIPAKLESYIEDVYTNWCQPPVTMEDINKLASLLRHIKAANPAALLEMPYTKITQEHYNLRDEQEVMYADEVYAFQVNKSSGTQHTIDAAKKAGIPIALHKEYTI